jgi:hypothetical protein
VKLSLYRVLTLGLLSGLSTQLHAEPEVPPVARNTTLTVKYDLQAIPSTLVIWDRLGGGYNDDNNVWGRNTLVCISNTDTSYGACRAIIPIWWQSGVASDSSISLKFSLKGTNITQDLVVKGIHYNCSRLGACGSTPYPASSALNYNPNLNFDETFFSYTIPTNELAKLKAGVWTATLKQNLMKWNPSALLHVWTANIILTVTNLNNQQIYFPAFPYAAPRVDLNLSNRPGTQNNTMAGGSSSLDMCLYDGSNSSSNRISLIFSDESSSAPGRNPGSFSVYREGADKTKAANRIDYALSVIDPTTGGSVLVKNGAEFVWSDTNQRQIQRQVVLPGVSGVSLCVPAPLRFNTAAFKLADKAAGHYTGKLTIIYTPSTQSNVFQ